MLSVPKSTTETPSMPLPEQPEAGPQETAAKTPAKREIGGRPGLDPTRYGDWEKNGRCIDF